MIDKDASPETGRLIILAQRKEKRFEKTIGHVDVLINHPWG
jgi:hypothetical protein